MKTTIFAILTAAALSASANSASALPPRYFNNNNAYYNSGYSGYYPNYYQGYSYGGYPYGGYNQYQNSFQRYYDAYGNSSPSTSYYGPSGRGGAIRSTPMSYRNGGNQTWNGRP